MNALVRPEAKQHLAFYNEIDPYLCLWLSNLSDAGTIPRGVVDPRSIRDVQPDDLEGFKQVHFFAGVGTWGFAALLAGWPEDEELWTASCPCQPFSVAGQGRGIDDPRHLWPDVFRLVRARRPAVLVGEQVAAAAGRGWLDGVFADLEGIDYTCRAVVLPACAVNAPHRRDRLWFVAVRADVVGDGHLARLEGHAGNGEAARGWTPAQRLAAAAGLRHAVADTDRLGEQIDPHARGSEEGSRTREIAGPGRADNGAVANADEPDAGDEGLQWRGQLGGAGGDPRDCAQSLSDTEDSRCERRTDLARREPQGGTAAWRHRAGDRRGAVADADDAIDRRWGVCGPGESAHSDGERPSGESGGHGDGVVADAAVRTGESGEPQPNFWTVSNGDATGSAWIVGHDGKARRVPQSRIRLLADGVPARIPKLRAAGNAIVPQVAAEVLRALRGGRPTTMRATA